jgi:hypothetical protein
MRTIRYTYFLLPLMSLWGCSCSDEGQRISVPEMVRPVLSAEAAYDMDADIDITVTFPASDWNCIAQHQESVEGDTFGPWHLRINGRYLRLDGGAMPLFPPTDSPVIEQTRDYTLNNNNSFAYPDSQFQWEPGEYKVAYAFRDITVCHPMAPEQEVHLDEWLSNEVTFQVIKKTEHPVP